MLFKKSKYVEITLRDELQRYRRPTCDAQLEWLSRLADITERQKQSGTTRLTLEQAELQQMREDLAGHLEQIDGEDVTFTADELNRITSPTEVFAAWAAFLQACQLQETDRGKSERQSTAHSTIEADTTAGPVQIRPNGHDVVVTP